MSARITDAMVEALAKVLLGRVNAPEQEIYRAARDGLAAALSTEPGEAEGKRAPVDYYKVLKRFAEEDGSIREGRLTALSFALAAAQIRIRVDAALSEREGRE